MSMDYNISYENYETHLMKSEIVLHGNMIKKTSPSGNLELLEELKNQQGAI